MWDQNSSCLPSWKLSATAIISCLNVYNQKIWYLVVFLILLAFHPQIWQKFLENKDYIFTMLLPQNWIEDLFTENTSNAKPRLIPEDTEGMKVAQSCLTLCNTMDYTVHGIFQARMLKWVGFPFSRGSSQPRNQTRVSSIAGGFFTTCAPREDPFYIDQVNWSRSVISNSLQPRGKALFQKY